MAVYQYLVQMLLAHRTLRLPLQEKVPDHAVCKELCMTAVTKRKNLQQAALLGHRVDAQPLQSMSMQALNT